MRRTSYEQMNCSIASALDVVGEPWTLLIVRDAFYGVRRFDDFQENLGIARNVLAARLKKLVEAGIFRKTLGVPTVVCGPGDIAVAHRPDEYVTVDQLLRCERFLCTLVDQICVDSSVEG